MSRNETTRKAIIEAFCLIYREKPLDKITVQEITRKAGYNRSTFYQYFFDIYDLLEHIEDETIEYIFRNRQDERKVENDALVKNLVELYNEKGLYMDALMGSYGNSRFLLRLEDAMQNSIPEMDIPDSDPLKAYRVQYRFTVSLSLFRLWVRRGKDLPVDEFLKLVWGLYQNGSSYREDG